MKLAIADPTAWNRFVSPYTYTPVQVGQTFRLVWTVHSADRNKPTSFNLVLRKGVHEAQANVQGVMSGQGGNSSGNSAVASQALESGSKFLRPQMGGTPSQQNVVGHMFFNVISSSTVAITPTHESSGGVHHIR